MDNVLEKMKAVYKGKVYSPSSIFLHSDKVELVDVFNVDNNCDICNIVDLKDIKPLLKFPDKDSEGNDCWSGDILLGKVGYPPIFIAHTKYGWRYFPIGQDGKLTTSYGNSFDIPTAEVFTKVYVRQCNGYDSNATEYLDQDTIDKLKEIV